jgi:hypothetical protein
MTVTDAIHHFNVGTLITLSNRELNELSIVLHNKITYMNQVIRKANVSQELRDDLRKYELAYDEIARLLEKRNTPFTPEIRYPDSEAHLTDSITII